MILIHESAGSLSLAVVGDSSRAFTAVSDGWLFLSHHRHHYSIIIMADILECANKATIERQFFPFANFSVQHRHHRHHPYGKRNSNLKLFQLATKVLDFAPF